MPTKNSMKLLRTIQLDPSDTLVFDRAAEPGEWAVSGGFMFARRRSGDAHRKGCRRVPQGFLGVQSFGWSTLAQVVEVTDAQYKVALELLTYQFREQLGAPDLAAASAAAEEELAFAISLCDRPKDTLIAVQPEVRGRRDPRIVPLAASAGRKFADAGLLVRRSRRR